MGLNDRDYMRDRSPLPKKQEKTLSFMDKLRFFLWRIRQRLQGK
jgi:hypothetical protein